MMGDMQIHESQGNRRREKKKNDFYTGAHCFNSQGDTEGEDDPYEPYAGEREGLGRTG